MSGRAFDRTPCEQNMHNAQRAHINVTVDAFNFILLKYEKITFNYKICNARYRHDRYILPSVGLKD